MSISDDLKMAADFLRTPDASMPASNAERLADLLDGLAGQMAGQEAQGCEFCSHPQYAGTKRKNCGREQPAQQQGPVDCKSLCELCMKRGYSFCANAAQTTPIPVPQPAQQQKESEAVRAAWMAGYTEGEREAFEFTSPPASKPLTDEQIEREWQFLHDEEGNPPDHHDFARAIEAAHGIKGDA